MITALGGVWHPEHFNCAYCRKNVVEEFFYEHDGAPYCTECHLSLFAPKCAFCGEAIVDVSFTILPTVLCAFTQSWGLPVLFAA